MPCLWASCQGRRPPPSVGHPTDAWPVLFRASAHPWVYTGVVTCVAPGLISALRRWPRLRKMLRVMCRQERQSRNFQVTPGCTSPPTLGTQGPGSGGSMGARSDGQDCPVKQSCPRAGTGLALRVPQGRVPPARDPSQVPEKWGPHTEAGSTLTKGPGLGRLVCSPQGTAPGPKGKSGRSFLLVGSKSHTTHLLSLFALAARKLRAQV